MVAADFTLTGNSGDFLKIGVAFAARGDIPTVREILRQRPDWIHHVGSHGRTMLWESAHRGKLPMVKYLVRRKANIDAWGSHYSPYFVDISCYCIARFKRHDSVADYLLEKGAQLDVHTAAYLGDLDQVKSFLKRNRKLIHQGRPQHVMAPRNSEGIEFCLQETDWATPLCYALRGGDLETMAYLIHRGSKIRGFEKWLMIAADDDAQRIQLLLENGADPQFAPDVLPDEGERYQVIRKYKKDISVETLSEELVFLCRGDRGGNPESIKRLLTAGANVNYQDSKGKTGLHRAAKAAKTQAMLVLLEQGASLNVPDCNGETPLFDAVRSTIKNSNQIRRAITLLLERGADVEQKNNRELDVVAVAKQSRHPESDKLVRHLKRSISAAKRR